MKIKDDGKMCGYEGEEWVSDYDFVPGRRQTNAIKQEHQIYEKNIKRKTFLKFNGKM